MLTTHLLMQTSGSQKDVIRCLQTMGLKGESENLSYGISIDILVPELTLAIEFDGPSHFFRNRPDRLLGKTAFKRRLLGKMGLKLVAITIQDWARLTDKSAQREYLQKKISLEGNEHFESDIPYLNR